MLIRQLRICSFRGWRDLKLQPGPHALVVGVPRAGRSDLVEAIRRVLDPSSTRTPPDEFDYHRPTGDAVGNPPADYDAGDVDPDESDALSDEEPVVHRAEVEVVLASLGEALEQHFWRRLELWDRTEDVLVVESTAEQLTDDRHELVLRLCYRLRWNSEEGIGEHWVDYPKNSDPDDESYDRARRPDRQMLPFVSLEPGQPLALRHGSAFRGLLSAEGDDLAAALSDLSNAVDSATDGLSSTEVVRAVLEQVFEPVRGSLGIDPDDAVDKLVRFRAEGGTVAGLLRALQPALRLGTVDALPLRRHGSTTSAVLAVAETLVAAGQQDAVVVGDDFGDQLDAGAAEYLARRLRRSCDQLWLSTRRPEAARSFLPSEMIRLSQQQMQRQAHQLAEPADRHELVAMRQLHLQLLPAMSSNTVIVLEGPHDVAALTALSQRRINPPAAYGARLVDGGGHGSVRKVCQLARRMGFRVIAGLDYDAVGGGADTSFAEVQQVADEVVRLPAGFAIERALVHGVDRATLITALMELDAQWDLDLSGLDGLSDDKLRKKAESALKSKSGLHAQYVTLLPKGHAPAIALALLRAAVDLARGVRQGPVTLTT
ncbi:TOPRIM nucleotidyl transferase/hydrolase domain-containing protein [Actinomycetospora flava]|uniref:TOPRIM nucleotidyl transferase/hydrolase domain-containing protein n=1 Tax=Actinomycetospora flava TaxID=3129232 RepID=A0ABU8M4V8_9PSEU